MATKSFLKSVNIKTRPAAKKFARAIAEAESAPAKTVTIKQPCRVATLDEVKKIFGENNE